MKGKYGPYIKWEKINATIPKDLEPENVTMDMAIQLIAEKTPAKKKKRKTVKKKKTATKKQ